MRLPVLAPMLAMSARGRSFPGAWVLEPKLDGWRALVYVADGSVTVRTRTGRNVTAALPDLEGLADALDGHAVVLDGELVAGTGLAADFYALGPRVAMSPTRAVTGCRVSFVAFDLLHLDGQALSARPYGERRAALDDLQLRASCWDTTWLLDADTEDALHACAELGLEGLVAKARGQSVPARTAVAGLGEAQDADVEGGPRRAAGAEVDERYCPGAAASRAPAIRSWREVGSPAFARPRLTT